AITPRHQELFSIFFASSRLCALLFFLSPRRQGAKSFFSFPLRLHGFARYYFFSRQDAKAPRAILYFLCVFATLRAIFLLSL
ncbi:MAG: hypothetical protein KKD31_02515, partial [Bacteroidetes bacterium]|nr:hypothetical protein [Bacteroidota bacterium]